MAVLSTGGGYNVTQSTEKNYLLGVNITENQQILQETPGGALASPVSVRQASPPVILYSPFAIPAADQSHIRPLLPDLPFL